MNTNSSSSNSYYFQFNETAPLSREEERKLMEKAVKGDKKAKDELVLGNIRFAYFVAGKYKDYGLEFDDLLEECIYGLVKATESINLQYKNRFSTYASYWILDSVNKALAKCGNVPHISDGNFRLMKKVKAVHSRIKNSTNADENTICRMTADELDITMDEVTDLLMVSSSIISLDRTVESEEGSSKTIGDFLQDNVNKSPEEEALRSCLKDDVGKVVDQLPEVEADVLRRHYGLDGAVPQSFQEIGDEYGYTKAWANLAEKKAKKHLHDSAEALEAYIA